MEKGGEDSFNKDSKIKTIDQNAISEYNKGNLFQNGLETNGYTVPTATQRSIIEFPVNLNEILSIRAGPGCGKTRTIIERVIYMVEVLNFKPQEILVLSMANRSVDSLKTKLFNRTKNSIYEQIEISTFHSFCSSLEDSYGELYIKNYVKKRIMDDLSWRNFASLFLSNTMIKGKKHNFMNPEVPNIEELIISIRNGDLSLKEVVEKYKIDEVYLNEIISYLDRNGMVRFPDLITNALNLIDVSLVGLNNSITLIPQLARYKAVIVDEFQDMHPLLLKILKKILVYPTEDHIGENMKHLTIAGDPSQCIYEFLGSQPNMMMHLVEHFPKYKITERFLNESFRLPKPLLAMCSSIMDLKDNGRDMIFSNKQLINKPILLKFSNEVQEYNFIVKEILRLIYELGGLLKPSDFIILARTNMEIDNFSKVADNYGIQCNKFSLSSQWIKSKVHILLDTMNVVSKGKCTDFGLMCIIMILDRKMGSRRRIAKLFNMNNDRIVGSKNMDPLESLESYICHEIQNYDLKKKGHKHSPFFSIYKLPDHVETIKNIKEFLRRIEQERKILESNETPESVLESLSRIVQDLPLIEHLNDFSEKPRKLTSMDVNDLRYGLKKNLKEFSVSLVASYNDYCLSDKSESFVEFFLRTYNDELPSINDENINVSTVHTAKGLEFPVVFLTDSKIGRTTLWDALESKSTRSLEATKRLFYVASTRAKNLLYVTTIKDIRNLPTYYMNYFTNDPPDIVGSNNFLEGICKDLGRNMPSLNNLVEGRSLYRNLNTTMSQKRQPLYSFKQIRKLHYNAYKTSYRIGLKLL